MTTRYGYSYETAHTARRFTNRKRTVKGITIHHWGGRGQRFDNVVSWFCDPDTTAQTSAHYVAQGADADGTPRPRVACIVDPDLIAWHAGDWDANVATVGIECRPEASAQDYAVVAELVARLWLVYGVVPLYPHKHWTSTACPGVWDLDKLRRLATDKLARLRAGDTPTPTPTPDTGDDDMPTPEQLWGADIIPAPDPNDANPTWVPASYLRETFKETRRAKEQAAACRAELGALRALVAQLVAQGSGTALTAEQITEATKAGAAAALDERIADADVHLEVTPAVTP